MDIFTEATLSAYFPNLVDICITDDGEPVYAILKDGELIFTQEHVIETEIFSIPERKHFPFELSRASKVEAFFNYDDVYLYDDVLEYLKRFSALDDEQWSIVAHYVFLTYLHDHPGIDYCPYLLFNAVPERGKSRTGKSIIYAAFRGIHLIELREATIFRYCQNLHGTLFFDLMDITKKAARGNCEDILLGRYEKGSRCNRVLRPDQGPFNDMEYFETYGPTLIASNEPLDKILETRCLPINMPNIPGNYETPRPEHAVYLKERLTAWRAKHLSAAFDEIQPIEGITGRLWDITKPLFLVSRLLNAQHRILEDAILAIAGEKDQSRKESFEGRLFAIIKEITDEKGQADSLEWHITINEIRARFNQGRPEDKHVSPQWIGRRLKNMSLTSRSIHGYSEIKITAPEYETLLKQYGYVGRESAKPTKSLPEKGKEYQEHLGEVGSGRHSEHERPAFNSPEEREFYDETVQTLREEGGRSEDEIRRMADEALEEWRKYDDVPF